MGKTEEEFDIASLSDEAKPCETMVLDCPHPARYMVWCDHHAQGCDYTGYRCDVHLNLLVQETRRAVNAMNMGYRFTCARCGGKVEGGDLFDHLRWMKL